MVFVDTIAIVNTIVITLASLKDIANEFTLAIFPHHGIASFAFKWTPMYV
jgi:hypothetical protein